MRRLVITGLPPRLSLERESDPRAAAASLAAAFAGTPIGGQAMPAHDPPGVRFGGLPIAERGFIDALLRYGTYDEYCLLVSDPARTRIVADDLGEAGADPRLTVRSINDLAMDETVDGACGEVVIHGACSKGGAAIAARERFFTPTTPTHCFLSGLSDVVELVPTLHLLFTAGRSYDCLTPLSSANQQTAERIFAHVAAYYTSQWGVARCFGGRFTQARLGVDTSAFARREADRDSLRDAMGLGRETIVFLYVGRLGPAYKADLAPLVYLFQREFARAGRDATLILAGHDEGAAHRLDALVRQLGAESRIRIVPDVDATQKTLLYTIADVFVTPGDSMQEALGLTLIEAMAAGLPVIASDWNGYRETVEDGVNGLLVKTWWNRDLGRTADRLGARFGLDRHLCHAQNLCVDMTGLRDAMLRLGEDAALRARFGRAGRERAERFAWRTVVPQLEDAWDESLRLAREARQDRRVDRGDTLYGLDVLRVHAHYPTAYCADADWVSHVDVLSAGDGLETIAHVLTAVDVPGGDLAACQDLYFTLWGAPPQRLGEVVDEHARRTGLDRDTVKYRLLRLVKYGLLTLTPAHGGEP